MYGGKKVLKILAIIVLVVLVAALVVSNLSYISVWKYHAKLYDYAVDWINEDFASENGVDHGGFGPNPGERYFIVNSKEEYEKIFVSGLEIENIDLDTKMIVVYTYSSVSRGKEVLTEASLTDGVLKISYREEYDPLSFLSFNACSPYGRWMVVVMDKLDVDSVVFEEK